MSADIDERRRRVVVHAAPAPSASVAETILELPSRRPELGGWDWVIDIRVPHQNASPDELEKIAIAFNARTSRQSYTIFVSNDPTTYDRCALMATKFRHRCHLVARDLTEAERLLPQAMSFI